LAKIRYVDKRFNAEHTTIIEHANEIIAEYVAQGYDLTLRQLYYQFVARDLLANTQQNYKRLGGIISDARRAGLIDWERIVDRTRYLRTHNSWESPESIVESCAGQFNVDFWENQGYRPEVWIEKDALVGVLQTACEPWRVPYFSCRGYGSDSELWAAAQRMRGHAKGKQKIIVLHLGDHDPSGIDMTRDIEERLGLFSGAGVERRSGWSVSITVKRIALNMNQVDEYNPPPNPAKETDSRFAGYRHQYGDESWELDALNPTTIGNLIAEEMRAIIDTDEWAACEARRDEGRRLLGAVARQWDDLMDGL